MHSSKITIFCLLLLFTTVSCSYGSPETSARVLNVLAMPDSHVFGAAVLYSNFRRPTGFINTFPNGGIPKILTKEARIYIFDADSNQLKREATIPVPSELQVNFQPWFQGWEGTVAYFSLYGQPGTSLDDYQKKQKRWFFRIHNTGELERIDHLPSTVSFQKNTGTLPDGQFLRISNDSSSISIKTEIDSDWRRIIQIDKVTGELVTAH